MLGVVEPHVFVDSFDFRVRGVADASHLSCEVVIAVVQILEVVVTQRHLLVAHDFKLLVLRVK